MSWSFAIASKVPFEILSPLGAFNKNEKATWLRRIKGLHPDTKESLTGQHALYCFETCFSQVFPGYRPPEKPYFDTVNNWLLLQVWIGEMATLAMDKITFPAVQNEYMGGSHPADV